MMRRAWALYTKIPKPLRRKLWASVIGAAALAASAYSPVAGPVVREVLSSLLDAALEVTP